MFSSYVAFIVELIIVRTGVLLIQTLGSFGVALNLFSADLGPSCHDFYFFIFYYSIVFSLSAHHFLVTVSSSWKVLARIPNFSLVFQFNRQITRRTRANTEKGRICSSVKE